MAVAAAVVVVAFGGVRALSRVVEPKLVGVVGTVGVVVVATEVVAFGGVGTVVVVRSPCC